MKNIKTVLKNSLVLSLLVSSFIACDKDYASIDSDIVNNDNATHFTTSNEAFSVITYSKKLEPVQTNNLPVNSFGIYNDPLYGVTTANFVSQLALPSNDPNFGEEVELDSVILTIPYFSKANGVDDNGNTTYVLDSVFGNQAINFSIYENNYFLRNFDPNSDFDSQQAYYSNGTLSDTETINESLLEGQLIYSTSSPFIPNANAIVLTSEDGETSETITPSLRLKLDKEFWQEKILDKQGDAVLSNQNNFIDYFRGLYFKTEAINNTGNMTLFNLLATKANVTLHYTKAPATEDGDRVNSQFILNFAGNRVNFFNNQYNFPLQDGNATQGDEKLYLKGGEGSIAVVNLFNGDEQGQSAELDELQSKNWLINEANLVFYVDQTQVQGQEPERIYLYDLENKTPLLDYFLDLAKTDEPYNSRINHLGKLEREGNSTDGAGIRYKIRITEHINNILINDSTNVKLGLAVSGNINIENNTTQFNLLNNEPIINKSPASSIISPRGTVLFGNNTNDGDKKAYLEIFYTEPEN